MISPSTTDDCDICDSMSLKRNKLLEHVATYHSPNTLQFDLSSKVFQVDGAFSLPSSESSHSLGSSISSKHVLRYQTPPLELFLEANILQTEHVDMKHTIPEEVELHVTGVRLPFPAWLALGGGVRIRLICIQSFWHRKECHHCVCVHSLNLKYKSK